MKIKIDIIAGFLSSGKTTLLNRFLSSPPFKDKRVLVISMEEGEERIHSQTKVSIFQSTDNNLLSKEEFIKLLDEENPKHIFLEYNGFMDLTKLFQFLEDPLVRKRVVLRAVRTTVRTDTFFNYTKNLGPIYLEPLQLSDTIHLFHPKELTPSRRKILEDSIQKINKDAIIFEGEKKIEGGKRRPNIDRALSVFLFYLSGIFLYFLLRVSSLGGLTQERYQHLFAFTTILVSILLQAIPFLLLGVLFSAIIQVFISPDLITNLFSKKPFLSMGMALIAGVFFPICDCAIIPVMNRLIKKGIPLSAAVTFMLAAPIVDPVVIISTFYAFPGRAEMALSRVVLGIIIAFTVGSLFHFFPPKQEISKEGVVLFTCSCGYCNNAQNDGSFLQKIMGVLRHGGEEFFHIGQFFIIAATFSSFIQIYMPGEILSLVTAHPLGSLLTMMSFAFILSICSTSDAFIARNFYGQFQRGPVMGFMVFGAMMDIKNLFLLLGHFKRGFVVRLITLIIVVSFFILSLFTLFL